MEAESSSPCLPSMSRMSENMGASTSRNPKVLNGLYRANFTFYLY
jgi:hypothetical protein